MMFFLRFSFTFVLFNVGLSKYYNWFSWWREKWSFSQLCFYLLHFPRFFFILFFFAHWHKNTGLNFIYWYEVSFCLLHFPVHFISLHSLAVILIFFTFFLTFRDERRFDISIRFSICLRCSLWTNLRYLLGHLNLSKFLLYAT